MVTTALDFLNEPVTSIERDLKLNFAKIVEGQSALTESEALLAVLSLASALSDQTLSVWARDKLVPLGIEESHQAEAQQAAAIMGMLNTYYKFRTMIKSAQGGEAESKYQRAGLRMNALNSPVLGKVGFEMLAFTVSVLNGCESCITAHEKTLLDEGVEGEKIHDLARLAAIVKGVSTLAKGK